MSVIVPPDGTRRVRFPPPECPEYLEKTDREIPILRLRRRESEPQTA